MKTILGGSTALILAVLISTGFLMGGCGGGGGSGSGSDTSNTPTKPIPPDINVSANQLLFGGIVKNNFTDRTITIQNKGSLNLNIGPIALADPLGPPFSIENDNCSLKTLAFQRTCTLQVRFSPVNQGAFNDTFDIPSNDPDESSLTVTVRGDGKGLNVSINQVSTSCPTVTLYFTVSDSAGAPLVPALTQDEFYLYENGTEINQGDPANHFVFSDTATSPQSIALVLDISASMDLMAAIPPMHAAAENFIGRLDFVSADPDKAEIIRFAKSIDPGTATGFTTNSGVLTAAIYAPIPNDPDFRDGTAMYDAVEQAVADTAAQGTGRRRVVVVIADGRDNSSDIELTALIDQALDSGVPVFTIGLGDVNAENMQQLADETGGQYYYAPTEGDLDDIYDHISEIISSQYTLTYSSQSPCGNIISLDVVVEDGVLQGEDSRDILLN
jgi:Ca-activated chloride channel family protein